MESKVKQLALWRVAQAKQKFPAMFDHVTRGVGGRVSSVRCKCCDTIIRAEVADSREMIRVGDKQVLKERVVFACLPLYQEVLIEFDDNSRHVTHICAECVGELNDPATLEAAYCADLMEWLGEGVDLATSWVVRKPARVLRQGSVIES